MPEETSAPVIEPAPTSTEPPWTKDTPLETISKHDFPALRKVNGLGFQLPHVLVSRDGEHLTIRNGSAGPAQLDHEIEDWYSFDKPEEDYPMGVQRLSGLNVMGRTVQVLDENSVPTAADYLACLGKRTLWKFSSVEMPNREGLLPSIYGKQVFKNQRTWIYLPPP